MGFLLHPACRDYGRTVILRVCDKQVRGLFLSRLFLSYIGNCADCGLGPKPYLDAMAGGALVLVDCCGPGGLLCVGPMVY